MERPVPRDDSVQDLLPILDDDSGRLWSSPGLGRRRTVHSSRPLSARPLSPPLPAHPLFPEVDLEVCRETTSDLAR